MKLSIVKLTLFEESSIRNGCTFYVKTWNAGEDLGRGATESEAWRDSVRTLEKSLAQAKNEAAKE